MFYNFSPLDFSSCLYFNILYLEVFDFPLNKLYSARRDNFKVFTFNSFVFNLEKIQLQQIKISNINTCLMQMLCNVLLKKII